MEIDGWQNIIAKNSGAISNVNYLKVPHHGSKNGLNSQIVEIIKPKIAVISVGANNMFGHPHKETIDLLQKIGADIYRTDLQSTIDIPVK